MSYVIRLKRATNGMIVRHYARSIVLKHVGRQGVPGADGPAGADGPPGADGADGAPGIQGPPGNNGSDGADGLVTSVEAGTGISVDSTDPAHPIVSATGGGGAVDSVNGQTGVVVLETDDVSDSGQTNKYVTAAEKTKLANTSGTNTGDQDLSTLVPKTTTVNGHALSSNVTVTKSDVGLGNADNTSDANKPVSTAQQTAIDAKVADAINNGTTTIAPSQNAVFDALALKEDLSNKDTDGTLSANSDTKYPSQKAVKTYADQLIASADAMVFKGVIDASVNPNYPAADKGWTYRISVAGKIGGASGVNVEVGDLIVCLADGTASGNQATVGTSWSIAQTNIDGAVVGPTSAADSTPAVFDGTTGKLIKNISFATFKTSLVLVKGDVGLGNVDNTSDANKPISTATQTALDAKQPLDADLTTIAGLTATTDNFMVATASAWASRTPSQARTQLGLGSVATLSSIDLTTNVTGVLPIANGGTNRNSQVTNGINYFDGTSIKSLATFVFDGTNCGIGATPDSVLTVSGQSTVVAPVSGTTAHFVGVDANSLRITYDTHNNAGAGGTALFGRRSRGTAGTPSAVQSGDTILSLNGQGYGTSQYPAASTGLIAIKARQAFTNSANGTDITFSTTPDGSVSAAEVARFTDTGLRLGVVGTMVGSLLFSGNTSGTVTLVAPAAAGSGTLTLPTGTDTLVGKATTDTFTNKTLISTTNTTEEITSITSSATPTPTGGSLRNAFDVTAQAAAAAFAAPSGTPVHRNKLWITIKDNGTARALTWDSIYVAGGVSLPSTTVLSKILHLGFIYNTSNGLNKWQLIASSQEA